MEDSEMSEQKTAVGSVQRHLTFLGIIGILVAIIGLGIVFIPGAPMRGSGIGTVAIILGILLVVADLGRARRRNQ